MVLPERLTCGKCAKTIRTVKKLRRAGEKKFRNALVRFSNATNEPIPDPELPICNKCRDSVVRYCKAVLRLEWKDAVKPVTCNEEVSSVQEVDNGQVAANEEDLVAGANEGEQNSSDNDRDALLQRNSEEARDNVSQQEQVQGDNLSPASMAAEPTNRTLRAEANTPHSTVKSCDEKIFLPNIDTVRFSEGRCIVCKSREGRHHIPKTALKKLWTSEEIFLPNTARACPKHFQDGVFDEESTTNISARALTGAYLTAMQIEDLMASLRQTRSTALVDVDSPALSNLDFHLLFGIGRDDFNDLFSYISPYLRDTAHRTARNSLAIFLAKMRLAVSQKVLSFMFGVGTQRKVSQIIARVSYLLEKYFISKHLGFDHITREEAIQHHGSKYVSELYNLKEDVLVIYIDGTYIYVQKSSDHKLQKELHSQHKHRALVKTMMVVLPSGYILDAYGLYKANNNDAVIFGDMIDKGVVQTMMKPGDQVVCDRGFRDAKQKMDQLGLITLMPSLLKKGQNQFTEDDCNATRKVTMTRWVVESANGRLKTFRFFDVFVPNHYYVQDAQKKLGRYLRICCALINKYFPPLFQDSAKHSTILDLVKQHKPQSETLQEEVLPYEKKRTMWLKATEDMVPDFPKLTSEDMFRYTLGSYQTSNAINYATQHVLSEGSFTILVHKEKPGLLKAKLASRFHSGQHHVMWIEYNVAEVLRYFCKCKVGTRSLGCCSHVATVIWYFGHRRHQQPSFIPKQLGLDILDASDKMYKKSKYNKTSDSKQLSTNNAQTKIVVEDDIETVVSSSVSSLGDIANLMDFEDEMENIELSSQCNGPLNKKRKTDCAIVTTTQNSSISRPEVDALIRDFFQSHTQYS